MSDRDIRGGLTQGCARRRSFARGPGASRRGNDRFNTHRVNSIAEARTIRRVTVAQQIARRGVPGKGLGHLAREPGLRRILGEVEVNDPSSIMAEEDQGVEKPKCRSCNEIRGAPQSGLAMLIWRIRSLLGAHLGPVHGA
jgi:hypothetical protein